jgi:hypothetical protein
VQGWGTRDVPIWPSSWQVIGTKKGKDVLRMQWGGTKINWDKKSSKESIGTPEKSVDLIIQLEGTVDQLNNFFSDFGTDYRVIERDGNYYFE